MTNMRVRAALEQIFFALGTTFTCFVILMSSTLHARTLGTFREHAHIAEELRTMDPDISAHQGLIEVEAMLMPHPTLPTNTCFIDPTVNECVAPEEAPAATPETLPATLEAALPFALA